MTEVLVVQSKVKEYIKKKGCNTSGDAVDTLSQKVQALLDSAVTRCKDNGRKTVKPADL
jgi:histone H3/H4